jgi:hypothetical protein
MVKVEHKDLSKFNVFGFADIEKKLIELDHRIKGKTHFRYCIHEILHILNPEWSERKVKDHTKEIVDLLWKMNYRRVDNRKK